MASAVRHTRTAPSISPRMMTGVPSDSAPRLEDDHARTHSITAVPPARRARRDLVHPGRDEPRRGRQRADRDSLRAGRGQCPGAFPLGLLQAPRRPGYPCSTRRSRRQAAIRSVIVTLTPLQVFSELDSQGGSARRCYQHPE